MMIPVVNAADAQKLEARVVPHLQADPYKFQDAVLVSADARATTASAASRDRS